MDDIKFNSVDELYNRLKPALYSKKLELYRENLSFIKEEDIWNYLVNYVWKKKHNLSINDLACDILYLNSSEIKNYVLEEVTKGERKIESFNEDLL